jgi:hypothetical protein
MLELQETPWPTGCLIPLGSRGLTFSGYKLKNRPSLYLSLCRETALVLVNLPQTFLWEDEETGTHYGRAHYQSIAYCGGRVYPFIFRKTITHTSEYCV